MRARLRIADMEHRHLITVRPVGKFDNLEPENRQGFHDLDSAFECDRFGDQRIDVELAMGRGFRICFSTMCTHIVCDFRSYGLGFSVSSFENLSQLTACYPADF
ncbi:MAG: hypothetical protein ACI856_002448 [Kiritimatiellia bacterium]